MKLFDPRSLKGGLLPLLHLDYDDPRGSGSPWELDLRYTMLACRVHGDLRPEDSGRPEIKRIIPEGEYGDVTGATFWYPGADRPIGSFNWCWPSIVTDPDDDEGLGVPEEPFGREGSTSLRPLTLDRDARGGDDEPWAPDERYRTMPTGTAEGLPLAPKGMHGIVGLASDEGRQTELWMFTDPRLVAPHRGGKKRHGSVLADVTADGSIDTEVYGHAQTLLRVTHADDQYQWSLNCAPSPVGGGGDGLFYVPGDGTAVGPGIPCFASYLRHDGLFHGGHATNDIHRDHQNADGEWVNPLHMWWQGLIYKNIVEDGPINWTTYLQGIDFPVLTKVYGGFNFGVGKWDWWTTSPLIPPPGDDDDPPPTDRIGEPTWGRGSGKGPGDAEDIGDGSVGNPWILEGELGVMSLVVGGTRHRGSMPGQGAWGGPGRDAEGVIDATGRSAGKTIRDAQDAVQGAINDAINATQPDDAIPVLPGTEPDLGTQPPPTFGLEGIGQDIENPFGLPIDPALSENRQINGRLGSISDEAEARGGPTPWSAHLWSLPQVDVNGTRGTWAYKSEPGVNFGNGTAKAAALMIGPIAVADGVDDQSSWLGDLDVFLYNGDLGGSAVRRFGWGSYDQTADTWSDGAVLQVTGSAGSYDLQMAFKDGDGANRQGQLDIGTGLTNPADLLIWGDVGFYGTSPASQQTVSGSRAGNAALASLLTALAAVGLIVDSSSA